MRNQPLHECNFASCSHNQIITKLFCCQTTVYVFRLEVSFVSPPCDKNKNDPLPNIPENEKIMDGLTVSVTFVYATYVLLLSLLICCYCTYYCCCCCRSSSSSNSSSRSCCCYCCRCAYTYCC